MKIIAIVAARCHILGPMPKMHQIRFPHRLWT